MYSNFNVSELNTIKNNAGNVFASILDDIRSIEDQCRKMGEIVVSDDSNLGARWNNVADSIAKPIETIDETFVVVKALLDAYVQRTIENEKKAQQELDIVDANISSLATKASGLLEGLNSLKGIGFGGTALAIAGVNSWNEQSNNPSSPKAAFLESAKVENGFSSPAVKGMISEGGGELKGDQLQGVSAMESIKSIEKEPTTLAKMELVDVKGPDNIAAMEKNTAQLEGINNPSFYQEAIVKAGGEPIGELQSNGILTSDISQMEFQKESAPVEGVFEFGSYGGGQTEQKLSLEDLANQMNFQNQAKMASEQHDIEPADTSGFIKEIKQQYGA